MHVHIFEEIYKNIQIPVLVCKDDDVLNVVFANTNAYILLNPTWIVDQLRAPAAIFPLDQIMHFQTKAEMSSVRQALSSTGQLDHYRTTLVSSGGGAIDAVLVASKITHEKSGYVIFYILQGGREKTGEEKDVNEVLFSILNTSYHAADIDKAVQSIIAIAGDSMRVSRVYVFEDLHNNYTRNTYEWCAPGIEPAIQDLQNLCKDDYNYDVIVDPSGLYVAGDIRTLPLNDYAILEPQGIKALAILPMFHMDTPIGYIGYDDCVATRVWSADTLQFLKNISAIVASLIIRRNAEVEAKRSRETLQTITDNTDSVIYVNDPVTYEIKFINRALAQDVGHEPDDIVGKPCWQVLQADMAGPCPFCPIPHLYDEEGNPKADIYEWEPQNTITGRWYWAKDSLIRWIDGNIVHFELAVDITLRKQYEKRLETFASIDAMTGILNREWGYKLMCRTQEESRRSGDIYSLCFIDLDGLKKVNDSYGHAAGDDMIHTIIERIRKRIRSEDMICRWGGDEFLVLLRCDALRADKIMRFIQRDLAEMSRDTQRYPVPLSYSYGIANLQEGDSVDGTITIADGRMYENKMANTGGGSR